jgi:hypothetical protein
MNTKSVIGITFALCLGISFLINSVIFTYFKARSADDWVKINSVSNQRICEKMGGVWVYSAGSSCQKP